ncbi:DUF1801 domain-containing protein [Motiliproteus sp. MSK22-1]|uniref:DUF1801 domain-containing protein n=1 Tax=Motiliproteus sp. MSK22-1 TaxID=1897630 RepID=UPI000977020F|nr:DUF1801 domain-containing protein [Motiliproteus sp. MSK22-1]OMH38075.1 hypothetical protein BGP75_07290 [Motiliproteus sp. MSK22-1]
MELQINPEVASVFNSYPPPVKEALLTLRKLIFETASSTTGVGQLEETLKWGEPSYLTSQSRSGSTIRLAWKPSRPEVYGIYFNCKTTLVDSFRTLFPGDFTFEGNRALIFKAGDPIPKKELEYCLAMALTYHLNK